VGRRSERSRVRGAPGGRARLRDYVDGQDIVAWITQGRISDRSREHLGRSDLGVILLRKLYAQERWN
jgi:hypothetical protein